MSIGMWSVYWVEVLRLIPTKDHLDREKLDAVLRWFDPEDLSNLEPLKVASDEQQNLYLLDGHCRAWALVGNRGGESAGGGGKKPSPLRWFSFERSLPT